KPAYSASVGRGKPGGGIALTLNFRRTLSQAAAEPTRSSKLEVLRLTGSSLGDCVRSLWHPTQYLSSIARYLTASAGLGEPRPVRAGIPWLTPGACTAGGRVGAAVWATSATATPNETSADEI